MPAQSAKVIDLTEIRLARAVAARAEMPCAMKSEAKAPLPVVWVPVWAFFPVYGYGG